MTPDERQRQQSVDRYELLSPSRLAGVDVELQNLAVLAQRLTRTESAAIDILSGDRQVRIAASPGVPLNNSARSLSMSAQVLGCLPVREVFVTVDASREDRFVGNPWVTGHLARVRYFAAAPLIGREGLPLGTLSVWSQRAGTSRDSDGHALRRLADTVMATLEARRRAAEVRAMLRDPATGDASAWIGPGEDPQSLPRLPRVAELQDAIAAGELEVHYQPVVDLDTDTTVSVEALVRWRHPIHGLLAPADFVPFAERCGLMSEVTDAVIAMVLAQTTAWAAAGRRLRCAVNLSAVSLGDPDHGSRLVGTLGAHADLVSVEVTESALADDAAVSVLRRLAERGVHIALDDFGTGFSSLARLKELPVTAVKIDRAFVHELDRDPRDYSIIRTILQLAQTLGLSVIAEGVETEAIADLLRASGVRRAQGNLYSRPLSPVELDAWLAARARAVLTGSVDRAGTPGHTGSTRPRTSPTVTSRAVASADGQHRPPGHSVGFHGDERAVMRALSSDVSTGLAGDGHVVVIASRQHIRVLRSTLPAGWLARAEREGRFVALDVDDTVALVSRDGRPDRDLFELRIGTVVRAHASAPGGLRLHSELGTLLSEQGDVEGALRVEDLFHRLQQDLSFDLRCSYPLRGVVASSGAVLSQVCRRHTSVRLDQDADSAPGSADGTRVVLETARTLLRVGSAEQAVGALMRAVTEFGGTCVAADTATQTAIPLDISLGRGAPLLPDAAPGSPARRTIERLLPELVEDARTAADTAERLARLSTRLDTDLLTGFGNRRGLGRLRLDRTDTVGLLDLDDVPQDVDGRPAADDDLLLAFARTMRRRLRPDDLLHRVGEGFVAVFRDTPPESALLLVERLRLTWTSERPTSTTFSAAIAPVEPDLDTVLRRSGETLHLARSGGGDRCELVGSSTAALLVDARRIGGR